MHAAGRHMGEKSSAKMGLCACVCACAATCMMLWPNRVVVANVGDSQVRFTVRETSRTQKPHTKDAQNAQLSAGQGGYTGYSVDPAQAFPCPLFAM